MSLVGKLVLVALALVVLSGASEASSRVPSGPVKHYVVLMMENRAYDHMLGWFQMSGEHLNGLTGAESNPWDPSDPSGKRIAVNQNAKDVRLPPLTLQSTPLLIDYRYRYPFHDITSVTRPVN